MLSACVIWNCKCAPDARMLGYDRLSSIEQGCLRKDRGVLRSKVTLRVVIGLCLWASMGSGTALAGSRVIPVAGGGELQAQVKATATKVIPAVVSIASTVMVRDQAFSDEALPF